MLSYRWSPLVLSILLVSLGLFSLHCKQSDGWTPLFNGENLEGWTAGENAGSVSVVDGEIVCNGPRTHLFYTGDVQSADFRNFEFKADVMAEPGANSGIYFHTAFQEEGWPAKGYEVQVNNTATGEGDYVELKKTGSLYGVRNIYKQIAGDNEWFQMEIAVRGKHVVTKVNGAVIADYVEPTAIVGEEGRRLSSGTFALQCHDPGSRVHYKNIEVRPLPDDAGAEEQIAAPVVDSVYTQIAELNRANFPIVDYHVHLKGGLTLEEALAKSRRDGINYGIAVNGGIGFPITTDEGIYAFLDSLKGQPVFVALQGEGREWMTLFSEEAINQFDYVFTDAMTFTDDKGRRTRLWMPDEVFVEDKQQFMDMYVDRILSVLNNEPIDIYVNPTFLPEVIAAEYDQLWTEARMQQVIDAAVKNDVAIEINSRYKIPSLAFIKKAREAGATFSCGTNNVDPNIGRSEYCLEMIKAAGLTGADMFVPKPAGEREHRKLPPIAEAR